MFRLSRAGTALAAMGLAIVLFPAVGNGDSITLNGVTYEDVLVYKSSTSYYVKVPREGRVLSAPIHKVDETTVSINEDPFYRDELKNRFDEVLERSEIVRKTGEPVDGAFQIRAQPKSGGGDIFAMGGGGAGIAVPLSQLKMQLSGIGFTFEDRGGMGVARSSDGIVTIEFSGDGDTLTYVKVAASVVQAEMAKLAQLQTFVSALAPWAGPWVDQNMGVMMQGGTIEKTQNGVSVSASTTMADGKINVEFIFRSV